MKTQFTSYTVYLYLTVTETQITQMASYANINEE